MSDVLYTFIFHNKSELDLSKDFDLHSVSVRVRPLSENEADKGSAWKIDSNKLLPLGQGSSSDTTYTLDNVFGSEFTTEAVYAQTTEDIIKKASAASESTIEEVMKVLHIGQTLPFQKAACKCT